MDEIDSALAAAAAENLRFFDFFPNAEGTNARLVCMVLSGSYFKYFPRLLAYDGYREAAYRTALNYAAKLQEEQPGWEAGNDRLSRIAAWELIRVPGASARCGRQPVPCVGQSNERHGRMRRRASFRGSPITKSASFLWTERRKFLCMRDISMKSRRAFRFRAERPCHAAAGVSAEERSAGHLSYERGGGFRQFRRPVPLR